VSTSSKNSQFKHNPFNNSAAVIDITMADIQKSDVLKDLYNERKSFFLAGGQFTAADIKNMISSGDIDKISLMLEPDLLQIVKRQLIEASMDLEKESKFIRGLEVTIRQFFLDRDAKKKAVESLMENYFGHDDVGRLYAESQIHLDKRSKIAKLRAVDGFLSFDDKPGIEQFDSNSVKEFKEPTYNPEFIAKMERAHEMEQFIRYLKRQVVERIELARREEEKTALQRVFTKVFTKSFNYRNAVPFHDLVRAGSTSSKGFNLYSDPAFLRVLYNRNRYYDYNFFRSNSNIYHQNKYNAIMQSKVSSVLQRLDAVERVQELERENAIADSKRNIFSKILHRAASKVINLKDGIVTKFVQWWNSGKADKKFQERSSRNQYDEGMRFNYVPARPDYKH